MDRSGTTVSPSGLSERVREVVRERRIDPQREAEAVRQVALVVVAEHERRSLTGAVRSLDEPERVVGQLVADVSGFGPLQAFLDDPEVEEIWINQPERVFVARAGRPELTSVMLTAGQVRELVERMLSTSGRRLDISQPFVDAMLPGGHRLHVVLEGISRGFAAVNIRKFVARAHSLRDLVGFGTLDEPSARFLDASVRAGLNIVVSGGTQAGKPTNSQDTHWLVGRCCDDLDPYLGRTVQKEAKSTHDCVVLGCDARIVDPVGLKRYFGTADGESIHPKQFDPVRSELGQDAMAGLAGNEQGRWAEPKECNFAREAQLDESPVVWGDHVREPTIRGSPVKRAEQLVAYRLG